MSRIDGKDTLPDVFFKMSDGNPGAITAMIELITHTPKIDPQAMMGGLGKILSLDTNEIYGSSIYVLWNDKCDRDIQRFVLLLRATNLGLFPVSRLKEMAADQMYKVNISDKEWEILFNKVCEILPDFARPPEKVEAT